MGEKFRLTGCFHNDDYHIEVYIGVITAKDRKEAEAIAFAKSTGDVFFELESGSLFYEMNGELQTLDATKVKKCEVFHPRKNINHETLLGLPIYEGEDFKGITFSELIETTRKESFENNRPIVRFENIAYGLYEM